jgi:hypothetical protein
MAMIFADVELINGGDEEMVRRHFMGEDEVRRFPISILVDTGSYMLAINENIQEQETEKKYHAENKDTLAVWDLQNGGWRSFKIESVDYAQILDNSY